MRGQCLPCGEGALFAPPCIDDDHRSDNLAPACIGDTENRCRANAGRREQGDFDLVRVDVFAAGCDAGIRYQETLEKDMIAVPIGPRAQCYALAASRAYIEQHGRPNHPRRLLDHACLRLRYAGGALVPWEFERDGETIEVEPTGPLVATLGNAADVLVAAAIAGNGILYLFEDWLRPHLESGALEPLLERWWLRFSGPFLYYPSRSHMPAALRAFIDFVGIR